MPDRRTPSPLGVRPLNDTQDSVTRYRAISTAEKRAQLEVAGEEWPIGDDGLPKVWHSAGDRAAGGHWERRSSKARQSAREKEKRHERGLRLCRRIGVDENGLPFCVHGPMRTSGKNWTCRKKRGEWERKYDTLPHRRLQKQMQEMTRVRARY